MLSKIATILGDPTKPTERSQNAPDFMRTGLYVGIDELQMSPFPKTKKLDLYSSPNARASD